MLESKLDKLAVSFVHGYNNLDLKLEGEVFPSLLIADGMSNSTYDYPFPRNVSDFSYYKNIIKGMLPLRGSNNFKKLPRFGFTGIAETKDYIFTGSWNSVYKIKKSDYSVDSIISNNLMSDLHGIYVDKDRIFSVLTGKDTIVISDHDGKIIDHFTIKNDLTTFKDEVIENVDWRFLSKQFRGSTGYWHFNYIQLIDNELWLTARNTNCFVICDLKTKKAKLKMMNLCTPALIHDGLLKEEKYYFTSIDGKIIIASQPTNINPGSREKIDEISLYNRDLITKLIRIKDTNYCKEPNWCRGIAVSEEKIYVTIDGRYDSDLSFGVLEIDEKTQKTRQIARLRWEEVGNQEEIRYVTGFDLITL